jgi:hypothetical protein
LGLNRYPHSKQPCHFEGAGAHATAIRETCFVFTPDPSLRLKCGSGQDDAKGSVASKAAELRSPDSAFDFNPDTGLRGGSLGEEVVEGFYGSEFVVFDIEDGVELGDVENVVNFLGEIEELEFASGVADGSEAADEFSDPGAVEVIDGGEVEDDFLLALGDQVVDSGAESADLGTEDDAAVDVEDGDMGDFAGVNFQGHGWCRESVLAKMVVGAAVQVNGSASVCN